MTHNLSFCYHADMTTKGLRLGLCLGLGLRLGLWLGLGLGLRLGLGLGLRLGLGSAKIEVQCTLNLILSLLHPCFKTDLRIGRQSESYIYLVYIYIYIFIHFGKMSI